MVRLPAWRQELVLILPVTPDRGMLLQGDGIPLKLLSGSLGTARQHQLELRRLMSELAVDLRALLDG